MDRQADRDRPQRQAVAQFGRSRGAAHQLRAHLQAAGSDDISLLAVLVFQQCQPGRAARIVLNGLHRGFDPVLVPLEIHQPDLLLVAAADAPRGHAAIDITPAGTLARLDQALLRLGLRNVAVVRIRDVARGRRQRSKCLYWHKSITFPKSATWRAEPLILPPDGWSVIGSAGYAVRALLGQTEREI